MLLIALGEPLYIILLHHLKQIMELLIFNI